MKRCQHDPVRLFKLPPPGNYLAEVNYILAAGNRDWTICTKCRTMGYWGGYGIKRKIRWGYGNAEWKRRADEYNQSLDGPKR